VPSESRFKNLEARFRNLETSFQISEAHFRPGASEMAESVPKSPEACFSQHFLGAPARIELRGFEAGGGSFLQHCAIVKKKNQFREIKTKFTKV
jgi:hypothetical protein